MNILGIHDGHNATVALFQGDRVTYALSEERLSRTKNEGGFPGRALDRVLAEAGVKPQEIARAVFTSNAPSVAGWRDRDAVLERYADTVRPETLTELAPHRRLAYAARTIASRWLGGTARTAAKAHMAREARLQPLLDRGFSLEQIGTMDHHMSHAVSAYAAAHTYDADVLVLTNDGGGDGSCATVSIGRGGKLEHLASIAVRNSIAALYARATYLLGMMPLEHEYKLMGLAPYANPTAVAPYVDALVRAFTWPDNAPLTWTLDHRYPSANDFSAELLRIFHRVRFDVIAGAMQQFVERMALTWVQRCIRVTGVRRLALAGGLFMNVKLNQKILALPEVESLAIMPSCGDESTPLGACWWGAWSLGVHPDACAPLRDLDLGPVYDRAAIDAALATVRGNAAVTVTEPSDIADAVAERLAAGTIVAWYQGREEFGARALGHRSILANPAIPEVVHQLNAAIKSRDFWMPFAGSMTEEQAATVLENPKAHDAPYMITTFDVRAHREDIAAATHPHDHTIRPQVVRSEWNPLYHRLLTRFAERSGRRGGVLNTSFNLHGYPIVSSPEDAIDVFLRSGLTHLALGPYLLEKA